MFAVQPDVTLALTGAGLASPTIPLKGTETSEDVPNGAENGSENKVKCLFYLTIGHFLWILFTIHTAISIQTLTKGDYLTLAFYISSQPKKNTSSYSLIYHLKTGYNHISCT